MTDKGTYMQGREERDLAQTALVHQGRLQALQSLDESVADIVRALRRQGVLKRTLIVFTSDNGWLLGEHRLEKKIYPYEESIKVPLLLRGPGLPQGALRHQPVGLVDITATVVAASGAAATVPQDGTSLLPMAVDGNILERRVLPIESGPAPAVQERHNAQLPDWFYRGIRSSRYAYIAWQFTDQVEEELYDLDEDPYQLESRHRQPSTELATARTYREQLQGCVGAQCVQELPPTMEDGEPRPAPPGDSTAPKVTVERAPRGWIRNARPKVRYAVTDATDPNRDLAHWCSHQAPDCDGEATLRLRGEGAHSWTVLATDPAGNVGSAWGRLSLDLFRPTVRRKGPPRKALESGRARLSWRVRDSGSGVVDVDTRRRTAGLREGFTAWAYPARLQDRRSPLRSVRLPAANGTVCLQVRARDKVGRRSGWRGQACRARAVDAARLTTGADWRTVERPRWYGGTGTVSSTRGSRLAVPNRGGVGLVRVVARTGPGMGKLRIDVGSRTVARIDLDRPRRGLREFNVRGGRGRVTATVVSAGRPVWVDSVGVVRRP